MAEHGLPVIAMAAMALYRAQTIPQVGLEGQVPKQICRFLVQISTSIFLSIHIYIYTRTRYASYGPKLVCVLGGCQTSLRLRV